MKIGKRALTNIRDFFIILLTSFGMAVAYYSFITPNKFAPGGIYGLGSMIQNKTVGVWSFWENGIPWAIPVIIMSIPLIIASIIVLNKKSAYVITLTAVSINAFDILLEVIRFPQYIAGNDLVVKLFAAAIGGTLAGVCLAFTLKRFGISDGTVAIAAIIKKKRMNLNIAWATFALDAIVIGVSFFVYWNDYTRDVAGENFGAKIVAASVPVVYSVVSMFFLSKFCDLLLKGFSAAYKFEVICSQPEGIAKRLMEELGRGVTVIKAEGMYTHTQKSLLICLVQKKQITDFKKILKDFPDAFAYIMPSNEVVGDFSGKGRR